MAAETGSKAGPQRESITDAGKSQKSGPVFNFIKIMKEQARLKFAIRTLPTIMIRIDRYETQILVILTPAGKIFIFAKNFGA